MLNLGFIETKISQRLKKMFLHLAKAENTEAQNTRILIRMENNALVLLLLNQSKIIRPLELSELLRYLDAEYQESMNTRLMDLLKALSVENTIGLDTTTILIGESNAKVGAHLYQASRYIKKLPLPKLFSHLSEGN